LHTRPSATIETAFKSQVASSYTFTAHVAHLEAPEPEFVPKKGANPPRESPTVILKQVISHCWNVAVVSLSSVSLDAVAALSAVCGPALVSLAFQRIGDHERSPKEAAPSLAFPSLRRLKIGNQFASKQSRLIDG